MAGGDAAPWQTLGLVNKVRGQWRNPFGVTKAVNLTNEEIYSTYVEARPIAQMATPTSDTPLLLTGGKGSGRTHLLRYWSYQVQALEYGGDMRELLRNQKYVGLYLLLGSLNASRFRSEETSEQASITLFGHYLDLAVSAMLLRFLIDLNEQGVVSSNESAEFVDAALSLMNLDQEAELATIEGLLNQVIRRRRHIDREINNAIFDGRPPAVSLGTVPGEPLLSYPELITDHFRALSDVRLSYLLDELENVEEPHQRFIQTLIREKRPGMSLIVGSRTYGVRTLATLTSREPNRAGAEFIEVPLDELMREPNEAEFRPFCREIAARRLATIELTATNPSRYFQSARMEDERFLESIHDKEPSPAIRRLRRSLERYGGLSREEVSVIENHLREDDDRLLEKLALLAFYKAWRRQRRPSVSMASDVSNEMILYRQSSTSSLSKRLGHFKKDLLAQLRREYQRNQSYCGFDMMIKIADGNPRNFMNMMQLVFMWAELMECDSPQETPIPVAVQERAIRDASSWFYRDSEVIGPYAYQVRIALSRLGELLEKVRFSQNLAESSLCAVTLDVDAASRSATDVIHEAENWSLLIRRSNRRDRNEERRLLTLQINRMLAPRWSLPIGRRGVLALNPEEVEAIFAIERRKAFRDLLAIRLARLNFDFESRTKAGDHESEDSDTLF